MKLCTYVEQHEITCGAQDLWILYILSSGSLNYENWQFAPVGAV